MLNEELFEFFMPPGEDKTSSVLVVSEVDSYVSSKLVNCVDLRMPKALIVLFELSCLLQPPESILYLVFRTIDRITGAAHRNQAVMNHAGLMTPIFNALYEPGAKIELSEPAKHLLRKTFRRLLDIGFCSVTETERFFKATLNGPHVNSDVLAILKSGSRSKWPQFFSFHNGASLTFSDESGKTFPPPSGFTFLVSESRQHRWHGPEFSAWADLDIRRIVAIILQRITHHSWC